VTSSAQHVEHPKQPDTESLGAPQSKAAEHSPSDVITLVEVLARYEQAGFETQMGVTEQAQVRCYACRADSPPSMVNLCSLRRLEGASDPADMLAVAAVECPHCAAKGLLVLGYGPDSTAEESQVLLALEDRRCEDDRVPPSSAPGEVSRT
jgi:hypothetical protein